MSDRIPLTDIEQTVAEMTASHLQLHSDEILSVTRALIALRDARHVIDIRNLGLIGGIELEPRPGKPTERALAAFRTCFDKGLLIRVTGDIIALSPPLIVEKSHIDQIVDTIRSVLQTLE